MKCMNYSLALAAGRAKKDRESGLKPLFIQKNVTYFYLQNLFS